MLPFDPLAANPLEDVRRAIAYLDVLVLAVAEEPNGLQIDKMYFGQIEDHDTRAIFNALPDLFDATSADPSD